LKTLRVIHNIQRMRLPADFRAEIVTPLSDRFELFAVARPSASAFLAISTFNRQSRL
jgi:hypothetical protein